MPITVELQDMLSYSLFWIILMAIVVAVVVMISIIVFLRMKKKPEKKLVAPPEPQPKPVNSNEIKQKYYAALTDLENKCRGEHISNRHAYQKLSKIVRRFVYEVTGIKVHHYTLEEIKRKNMPNLYNMIAECYTPEFAENNSGNIYDSINRARKVIEEWN